MANHLRINSYVLSHGNSGISVHEDQRGKGLSNAAFKKKAVGKILDGLIVHDSLAKLKKLLEPKHQSGIEDGCEFRRDDLSNIQSRVLIENAARKVINRFFEANERDEAFNVLMQVIDLNAARKDAILETVSDNTADTIAEVLNPSWRPKK